MSDHESGDGKMGAFLLGFILGVLVCLGVGGVFVFRQTQMQAELAAIAAMERDRAVQMEMHARLAAEEARKATEEALKKAETLKKSKEKSKEKDKE